MRGALFAILILLLAGCADPAPPEQIDDTTAADENIEATKDTGVIRGVVVDPQINPIPGAKIVVRGQEMETESLEDGSFAFSGLEPGAYFLDVTKLGYGTVQTSATVVAGVDKPEMIRVQLVEDLSSLPFTTLESFNGYLQCGVGLGPVGSTNPCAFTGSVNVFGASFTPDLNTSQIEMIWEGTNALGDGLDIGILTPGTLSNFAGSDGPSPRILTVAGDAITSRYEGSDTFTLRLFPGNNANGANPGISVVIEQRVEIFVTNFYGFNPDEGWAFITDGEHEIPE